MKKSLPLIAVAALLWPVGHVRAATPPPSRQELLDTVDHIGRLAHDAQAKLGAAETELAATQAELTQKQAEIDALAKDRDTLAARYNAAAATATEQRKLAWKWRLLSWGSWGVFAVLVAGYFWLRNAFPLLKFI